jgi:hypothetical protein
VTVLPLAAATEQSFLKGRQKVYELGASPQPISGTVCNFAGKIAGMLSTENASATAANEITVSTQRMGAVAQILGVVIPPQAQNTVIALPIVAAAFRGALSSEAEMTVIGTFTRDTGQGLLGSNRVLIRPSDGLRSG